MTSRESYIFGWIYGRIYVARGYDKGDADQLAAMRPYSANAKAITAASREGLLKGDLDMEIMEALNQIHSIDPPVEGGSEKVQPLEIQNSWWLGYYKALKGESLPPAELDVKAMRVAKGMTQAELAQAIGTDQAVISRWEKGVAKPNEESIKKLMEALK